MRFLGHRRQEITRCALMVFFIVLLFVTAFQEAYTQGFSFRSSFTCAREEQLSGGVVAGQLAFVLSISMSYLVVIL